MSFHALTSLYTFIADLQSETNQIQIIIMNQRKDVTLTMIGFRVDPSDLKKFDHDRGKNKITRSESLRAIFNNYINHLKIQEYETIDRTLAVAEQVAET